MTTCNHDHAELEAEAEADAVHVYPVASALTRMIVHETKNHSVLNLAYFVWRNLTTYLAAAGWERDELMETVAEDIAKSSEISATSEDRPAVFVAPPAGTTYEA